MSPQRAAGEDPAITDDLYSVGATLYELLTGKPPFYVGDIAAQASGKIPVHDGAESRAWNKGRGCSEKLGGNCRCLSSKGSSPASPECDRNRKAIEERCEFYCKTTASSSTSTYPTAVAGDRRHHFHPDVSFSDRFLCVSASGWTQIRGNQSGQNFFLGGPLEKENFLTMATPSSRRRCPERTVP